MDKRGAYHDFQSKFLSHSAENFRKGILLFLRKFLVSKSFENEKGGITFFRRKFLVSQCRKISWASLQCFRNFGVSNDFMHTRGYHVGVSRYSVKKFWSHSAEKFRGHPINVSENLGYRKTLCLRGEYHDFL